jgi:polar amino acid transport system substrate-binding protein
MMRVKMHLGFLGLLALLTGLAPIGDAKAGEVLDRVMKSGVIRMPNQGEFAPFTFTDSAGVYTGFDIDVTKEIARRMGVKAEIVKNADGSLITWDEQTDGTKWGDRFDMVVADMTPTSKRAEHISFPVVYFYALSALCVHNSNTSIVVPSDASGKRIGVLKAATFEMYLRRQPFGIEGMEPLAYKIDDPKIVTFDDETGSLDALSKGDGVELDASISYLPVIMDAIKKGEPLRIVGQPLYYVPQSVAIMPGDAEFAAEITKIVDDMHKDGTLSALSTKWLGLDMTTK